MKPHIEPRSSQALPGEIVADLLQAIRGQFYGDLPEEDFHEQRRFLTRVITWPAARLTRQGVTLSPARYKAIFLDVLDGIKIHGASAAVRYWPGYLLHCVQEHWRHHGDEYYEEGQSVRCMVDKAIRSVAPGSPHVDPIEALSQAAALLRPKGRSPRSKARGNPAKQLPLFG